MTTTAAVVRVIALDHSVSSDRHGYTLTRIARLDRYRVRVCVHRNSYVFQSFAVAEVLADNLTWTHLASDAAADWFDTTAHPSQPVHCDTELGQLAENLIHRAADILLR